MLGDYYRHIRYCEQYNMVYENYEDKHDCSDECSRGS